MDNQTNQHNTEQEAKSEDVLSEDFVQDGQINENSDELIAEDAAGVDNSDELEKKIEELKDLYVRAQAEMQNVQRRSSEEIKKARDYAISSFAKDIIVVKDYLEMALKDQSGNFEAIKMGVDLTLKQLVQIFERHLIKEIEPKPNDKLDPHLHQAMSTVEEEGTPANSIVSVMQKGYILNERVLRPAMVTVTK